MSKLPKMTFRDYIAFSMTKARAARWESSREKGMKRFILLTGILGWGVPMFVVMTFFINQQPERPLTATWITFSALLWVLFAGSFFGWMLWKYTEKQYREFLEKEKQA